MEIAGERLAWLAPLGKRRLAHFLLTEITQPFIVLFLLLAWASFILSWNLVGLILAIIIVCNIGCSFITAWRAEHVGKLLVSILVRESRVAKKDFALLNDREDANETQTSLRKHLRVFAVKTALLFFSVSAVLVFIAWLRGAEVISFLVFGIALFLTLMPRGLGLVLDNIVALSRRRMAKKGAVVLSSGAAEMLGVVDVICLDPSLDNNLSSTIRSAETAGIKVLLLVASAMEEQIILAESSVNHNQQLILAQDDIENLSERDLALRLSAANLILLHSAERQLQIINKLKDIGCVVAVISAKTDDFSLLEAADLAITSVNSDSSIRKISDVVLTTVEVPTIITAIQEGRNIFNSLQRVIAYILAFGSILWLVFLLSLMLDLPIALLPMQIVWICCLVIGLLHMALGDEPAMPALMLEPAHHSDEGILSWDVLLIILIVVIYVTGTLLALLLLLVNDDVPMTMIRTILYFASGLSALMVAYNLRSLRYSALFLQPFRNWPLCMALLIGGSLLFLPLFLPALGGLLNISNLPTTELLLIGLLVVFEGVMVEVGKLLLLS